jgi:hypothetical protein
MRLIITFALAARLCGLQHELDVTWAHRSNDLKGKPSTRFAALLHPVGRLTGNLLVVHGLTSAVSWYVA